MSMPAEAGTASPSSHAAERPAVPLGYASGMSRYGPPPRLWAAGVALGVGLVLLWTAMSALRGLAGTVTGPMAAGLRNSDEFVAVMVMTGFFAFICTMAALMFLVVGLKWLRNAAHAA